MTLWDTLSSFMTLVYSSFAYRSDYAHLILSDASFVSLTTLYYKVQYLLDCISGSLSLLFTSVFGSVSSTTVSALVIALKFLVLIALLIFIRGGIPRYRFDHLTKIGWIKYLSLVLASILIQFLLLWMC